MFHKILIGLDGSEMSEQALDRALTLASLTGAELHALSVEEKLPAYAATVGEVTEEEHYEHRYLTGVQARARKRASERRLDLQLAIVAGHAAHALVEQAKAGGFDLIVIGHTGHSRLHNIFLGSTADRVVESAPCSVLVVHGRK
jgi:nucleotide-binding universal stress UspA family protein